MIEAARCGTFPPRLGACELHGCCCPLQKYSNRADESATATKRVRVRFLSAIEVQGGPYLKGYVKGMSLPLIESFLKKNLHRLTLSPSHCWTGQDHFLHHHVVM